MKPFGAICLLTVSTLVLATQDATTKDLATLQEQIGTTSILDPRALRGAISFHENLAQKPTGPSPYLVFTLKRLNALDAGEAYRRYRGALLTCARLQALAEMDQNRQLLQYLFLIGKRLGGTAVYFKAPFKARALNEMSTVLEQNSGDRAALLKAIGGPPPPGALDFYLDVEYARLLVAAHKTN